MHSVIVFNERGRGEPLVIINNWTDHKIIIFYFLLGFEGPGCVEDSFVCSLFDKGNCSAMI